LGLEAAAGISYLVAGWSGVRHTGDQSDGVNRVTILVSVLTGVAAGAPPDGEV
jgi:hypothetical protein